MLPNPIDPGKLLGFRLVAPLSGADGEGSFKVSSIIGSKVGIKPVGPGDGEFPGPRPQVTSGGL